MAMSTDTWLELPDAPSIGGLRFRRPRPDDAEYEALAELTAPGQPYEIVEIDAIGRRIRAFKNAPQNTREIFAATRSDKKARGGLVEYALPQRVGAMACADRGWSCPVSDTLVLEVLR